MILCNKNHAYFALPNEKNSLEYIIRSRYRSEHTVPKEVIDHDPTWVPYCPIKKGKWYSYGDFIFKSDGTFYYEEKSALIGYTIKVNGEKTYDKNHFRVYNFNDIFQINEQTEMGIDHYFKRFLCKRYKSDMAIITLGGDLYTISNIHDAKLIKKGTKYQLVFDKKHVVYEDGVWAGISEETFLKPGTYVRLKRGLDTSPEDFGLSGMVLTSAAADLSIHDTYRVEGYLRENTEFLIIKRYSRTHQSKYVSMIHSSYMEVCDEPY